MKYLVTGGTGFLGSALVRGLVAKGHSVRVLDNGSRGRTHRLEGLVDKIEMIEGDIRDPAVVTNAVRGTDSVAHLAYVNGTRHFYEIPEVVMEVAVKGMINVLDACRETGVGELILASSSEVYQTPPVVPTDESAPLVVPDVTNPRFSYGGGKIACELMLMNMGKKYLKRAVVFRPHNVYGPDMGDEHVVPQFVARMKKLAAENPKGELAFPIQGDGKETRSFVYVDDFTDGLLRVIEKGEHLGIYHIGSGVEVSIRELAEEVGRAFGRTVNVVPGPLLKGSTLRRCPDIAKLRQLGFKPRTTLAEGIRKTVEKTI